MTQSSELPEQSKAPHIVAEIYAMPDMTQEGKRALAGMFLASYRVFVDEFRKETANA